MEACPPHSTGAPLTSPSHPLRYACLSFAPRQAAHSPTSARRSLPLCLRLALTSHSRPAPKASSQAQPRRARRIRPHPHRSAIPRDLQTLRTPSPRPASSHSKRPSCCPLARLLHSMPACSPLASSQLPSSPSVARVADPDQLRPHPPSRIHRRTRSLSQPQPLCPNLMHELHLPSRRRIQVNKHVRTHLLPLPTGPPLRNALLLPFPRPVRLRAALQRPARPRIPSHSVARRFTRDTR